MMRRHHYTALTVLLAAMTLSACGSTVSYKPEQSGVYIQRDGGVESAEIEPFDNSEFTEERYKEEDLLVFVQDAVKAYNKDSCGVEAAYRKEDKSINVGIVELEVKNSVAKLVLDYTSCEQYVAFNQDDDSVQKLDFYSAPDAVAKGISLDGLKDAEGKDVDTTSAKTSEKYHVVVVNGTTQVVTQGKIIGFSGEAQSVNAHTLTISGEQDVVILFK